MDLLPILRAHQQCYPVMTAQDAVKLVYQAVLGPNHLGCVPPSAGNWDYVAQEMAQAPKRDIPVLEPVGGGLCRLHLDSVHCHLTPQRVQQLFALAAAETHGSIDRLEEQLALVKQACADGALSFDVEEVDREIQSLRQSQYAPVSHSKIFHDHYDPHYRLVSRIWSCYLPAMDAIDRLLEKKQPAFVAIDGRCASGKSTLAAVLGQLYDCNIIHMDDFFLPMERKTKERLAEPGGNVDRERFWEQVVLPLREGQPFAYGIFSCHTGKTTPSPLVFPAPLTIVEGSYSLHPLYRELFDLSIFLTCSPTVQEQRILDRNGPEMLQMFRSRWIPMEEQYFNAFDVEGFCGVSISTDGL